MPCSGCAGAEIVEDPIDRGASNSMAMTGMLSVSTLGALLHKVEMPDLAYTL